MNLLSSGTLRPKYERQYAMSENNFKPSVWNASDVITVSSDDEEEEEENVIIISNEQSKGNDDVFHD